MDTDTSCKYIKNVVGTLRWAEVTWKMVVETCTMYSVPVQCTWMQRPIIAGCDGVCICGKQF